MDKDQAESYYYINLMKKPTSISGNIQTQSLNSTTKTNAKYLMFDLSYKSETKDVTFIEIPLRYNIRASSLISNDAYRELFCRINIIDANYDR